MITVEAFMAKMHEKVGIFAYDHEAASATRFGQSTGNSHDLDWAGREGDCSGVEIGALVAAGWKRYTDGFPESSGDMARWAVNHPDHLLWDRPGNGMFDTVDQALAVYGAIWVLGGFVNGDAGHTGASDAMRKNGGWQTTESASSLGGMAHGSTFRFKSHPITHVLMAPGVDYHLGRLADPERKVPSMDAIIRNSKALPASPGLVPVPLGSMFHYTGTEARQLSPTTLRITKDMLRMRGQSDFEHDGQDFLIDELRHQKRLIVI